MTRGMPFPESLAAITQHTSRAGRVTTHDTRGAREEGRGGGAFDRTRIKKKFPYARTRSGKSEISREMSRTRNSTNEKSEATRTNEPRHDGGRKNELRRGGRRKGERSRKNSAFMFVMSEAKRRTYLFCPCSLATIIIFNSPAALDLIHSGWLHYSYYSASVRSFRSSFR